jgi:hypothetical protein
VAGTQLRKTLPPTYEQLLLSPEILVGAQCERPSTKILRRRPWDLSFQRAGEWLCGSGGERLFPIFAV